MPEIVQQSYKKQKPVWLHWRICRECSLNGADGEEGSRPEERRCQVTSRFIAASAEDTQESVENLCAEQGEKQGGVRPAGLG